MKTIFVATLMAVSCQASLIKKSAVLAMALCHFVLGGLRPPIPQISTTPPLSQNFLGPLNFQSPGFLGDFNVEFNRNPRPNRGSVQEWSHQKAWDKKAELDVLKDMMRYVSKKPGLKSLKKKAEKLYMYAARNV